MSQLSYTEVEFTGKREQTRREKFLSEVDKTIPWGYLAGEVAKHYPDVADSLPAAVVQLSDPAMEEALYEVNSMRQFAKLPGGRVPDETTILSFRYRLEANDVAEEIFEGVRLFLQDFGLIVLQGTIVDTTTIDAPSSPKNAEGRRNPEVHQARKGDNYFFGMKAHIGVNLHTGLVHSMGVRRPRCTETKRWCLAMRATRAWTSARSTKAVRCSGSLRCTRARSRR